MVDAHEVTLSESDFEMLNNGSYLILNLENIEVRDYVLFHKQNDANSFCMTRINRGYNGSKYVMRLYFKCDSRRFFISRCDPRARTLCDLQFWTC